MLPGFAINPNCPNTFKTCFESDTSNSKDFPFKFLATFLASEDKISQMIIWHPSSWNFSAIDSPKPLAPPVITATLPFNRLDITK